MERFLETHKLPKLNPNNVENLSSPITSKEIKSVIKEFLKNGKFRTRWIHRSIPPNIYKINTNPF